MIAFEINILKDDVYAEVKKTTAYTGAKMTEDTETAYNRISTTDADKEMLDRYWKEACDKATDTLKQFVVNVSSTGWSDNNVSYVGLHLELSLPNNFDSSLESSIINSLTSYMVNSIAGKWFLLTNKKESEKYGTLADNAMEDVKGKIYYRKKPTRTAPVKSFEYTL